MVLAILAPILGIALGSHLPAGREALSASGTSELVFLASSAINGELVPCG